ncbi:MAG: heme ABC transporter ATP-binding protein [Rhodobacteraceae bacterium]|nr:heme ABC transporter ATP-binding protein [Paracoccaceae bacterium]
MLTATNLTIHIGQRAILTAVDFQARAGAITAIVGPNGCGKTTLMRALTGEVAGVGDLSLNGVSVNGARPARLAAMRAVLPQATPLAFPFLVGEVVRLGLSSGLSAGDPQVASQALAAVGLNGFANRFYQELSGGEQQRVQLARVLAQVWMPAGPDGPRWLLLDEPVASLDIGHQLMVMNIARAYADAGGGVVAVMHDLNLTAMFADTVTLLGEGGVLGSGRPSDVLTDALLSRAYHCALAVNTPPADRNLCPRPTRATAA